MLVRIERNDLPFPSTYGPGQVLRMPIAHAGGCYFDSDAGLDELEASSRVVLRYAEPDGGASGAGEEPGAGDWNPGGSARAIAGICNEGGNVLGLMPHPERCSEALLGNDAGLAVFMAATGGERTGGAS